MGCCNEYTQDWFVNDIEEPYTARRQAFSWLGRLRDRWPHNVWGRVAAVQRLGLQSRLHDGYGENWPISYKDIAPYYDQAENCGITGMAEGLEGCRMVFQPPMALNCRESVFAIA
jgi:choline dehydrogenase-like flavoprotein